MEFDCFGLFKIVSANMKILYIHQYFITPKEPGGTRSYWIAQEMIKQGHEVVMLTASSKFEEKIKRVTIDGIKVIYVKEEYDQKMSIFKRLLVFVKFMIKSTMIAYKEKEIELVVATSTPLTIGFPALILKWFKRIPYVFEVRDLWPEVPIQMGALKNPLIKFLAVGFEKLIYKNAVHIIALSPGMQEGVAKFVPKEKISMIPNMSKKDEFWPRSRNIEFLKSLHIKEDSFKIVHFGSLGLANGADTIIESARLLKEDSSIEFLFVGGGSTEQELKDICTKDNIQNVKFLGKFSMEDTSEIVNFSDVSIVSFKDLPILYTNSPNKLFDSLSAGKPIIVNSNGWTKNLVEKYECGFYVNPNEPMDLVQRIKYLQNHPDIAMKMGVNSRMLAANKYDKSILTKEFVEVIEKYHV